MECGFQHLEDVTEGPPIFRQRDQRVEAHIVVATSALYLKRTREHQLATTPPGSSSTDTLATRQSIGIAELNHNGRAARLASFGGRDARRALTASGVKDRGPPDTRIRSRVLASYLVASHAGALPVSMASRRARMTVR